MLGVLPEEGNQAILKGELEEVTHHHEWTALLNPPSTAVPKRPLASGSVEVLEYCLDRVICLTSLVALRFPRHSALLVCP